MDRLTTIPLRIGEWRLDSQAGQLTRGDRTERLEARTLRLLVFLANRAGDTVSVDELLDHVWSGVVVTQDSVYQAVTALRRLLGDDAKQPTYIATVPRLGYRLIAPVSPWSDEPLAISPSPVVSPSRPRPALLQLAAAVGILMLVAGLFAWRTAGPSSKSVAVLPFLDLTTQEMKEEYFADGLTEALIDHLSKLPDFDVPSPTASYYYKDKALPVGQIGRELDVRYLLDGSLRESGDTMRISARLVRASDGFVVWSAGFDAPKSDRVKVQDEVASQVAQSVTALVD
ncbi:MAG: winged helix-turn-helix domain-containing protein [Steroidobacteraceae bacterium]|nr:winged helix-turn-helix domain-containing protein [Steroidobacteraceae bacterium]